MTPIPTRSETIKCTVMLKVPCPLGKGMEIVSFSSDALVYFIFNKIMIQLLQLEMGK